MTPAHSPISRSGDAFAGAKGWLNTDQPLSLSRLAGHVVLLDFWSYCCINCVHVLRDLKALEKTFAGKPFVVIGVHSGKFDHEKDPENIRRAIQRLQITHPVVVDSDFAIWRRFGVHAWPTMVLIDASGKPMGLVSGEGNRATLERYVHMALDDAEQRGVLAKAPLELHTPAFVPQTRQVSFPGKVLHDPVAKRLFVADSGHHRVLELRVGGQVQRIFGSGSAGLKDGRGSEAEFNEPQGMALSGRYLYVADRENHALRRIDLGTSMVETLAGDGEQGFDRAYAGAARPARLNSPWDLTEAQGNVYIAMAGLHQLWRYDPAADSLSVHAGSGREACTDGPHHLAAFAQPSGICTDGSRLYVADSEVSSIRCVDLNPQGVTSTLAGSRDLFGFGLRDGTGDEALFQHPMGISCLTQLPSMRHPVGQQPQEMSAVLLVADTYNQTIRTISTLTAEVGSWPARIPGVPSGLLEPGGISTGDGIAYIADTNHHRIVTIDLATGRGRVLPLDFIGRH